MLQSVKSNADRVRWQLRKPKSVEEYKTEGLKSKRRKRSRKNREKERMSAKVRCGRLVNEQNHSVRSVVGGIRQKYLQLRQIVSLIIRRSTKLTFRKLFPLDLRKDMRKTKKERKERSVRRRPLVE